MPVVEPGFGDSFLERIRRDMANSGDLLSRHRDVTNFARELTASVSVDKQRTQTVVRPQEPASVCNSRASVSSGSWSVWTRPCFPRGQSERSIELLHIPIPATVIDLNYRPSAATSAGSRVEVARNYLLGRFVAAQPCVARG